MTKLTTYFREAVYELKKVSWPTKKQTINYSAVVLFMTLSIGIFFAILDYIFTWGLGLIV